MGAFYEEVVPYVVDPMDVVTTWAPGPEPALRWADGDGPDRVAETRWVVSDSLPRLALQIGARRFAILNQVYMTNHLSFFGLALGQLSGDPLYGARFFHALFGVAAIVLVHDIGASLLTRRAALLGAALAATSFNLVFMFTWARFDESLPSVASLAVLAALLRFARDGRSRWLYAAAIATGVGVSAKITTLWPLGAMLLAAFVANVRRDTGPRSAARTALRSLRRSQIAVAAALALPWLVPMIAHARFAPGAPTSGEALRRLGFLSDLVTTDVVPRTLANMVDYLGSWSSLAAEIVRGPEAPAPSWAGRALVLATLGYLGWAAFRRGPAGAPERRTRVETAMLVFIGAIAALVSMFYREHRDYQFVLLVPLFSLAVAHSLDALMTVVGRALPGRAPSCAACAIVAAAPMGAQLADCARFWRDLGHAKNAMLDQRVQRDSAEYLERARIRPITTTFYAVGQYELLTRGRVRPLHASNLFRNDRRKFSRDELLAIWRRLLAIDCRAPRYVLLPLGSNPVEQRHFDEEGIRAALLADSDTYAEGITRLESFVGRGGEPLLELYRVEGCPLGPIPPPPASEDRSPKAMGERPASGATMAALGGLTVGARIGELVVSGLTEPVGGAILVHTEQGITFEVRLASDEPPPPARAGAYAVFYRKPREGSGSPPTEKLVRSAQAIADRIAGSSGAGPTPPGLTTIGAPVVSP
jgi:hypothetical protein